VKGSAAGQYLGYALQPVRLFYHLLKCNPDATVGLEHVDDISVHSSDGVRNIMRIPLKLRPRLLDHYMHVLVEIREDKTMSGTTELNKVNVFYDLALDFY